MNEEPKSRPLNITKEATWIETDPQLENRVWNWLDLTWVQHLQQLGSNRLEQVRTWRTLHSVNLYLFSTSSYFSEPYYTILKQIQNNTNYTKQRTSPPVKGDPIDSPGWLGNTEYRTCYVHQLQHQTRRFRTPLNVLQIGTTDWYVTDAEVSPKWHYSLAPQIVISPEVSPKCPWTNSRQRW